MTLTQACAHLNICVRTFMNYIEEGEISPYPEKIGNVYLFEAEKVDQLRKDRLRQKQRRF